MTDEKSFWPTAIEKVDGAPGKPAKHIDPETGKQTYPSWHLRTRADFLHPEDLGEKKREPTDDDRLLMHRITHQVHIDELDISEGLETNEMIRVVRESLPPGSRRGARHIRQLMYGLWHAGLIRRHGVVYNQSGRPAYQKWYLA